MDKKNYAYLKLVLYRLAIVYALYTATRIIFLAVNYHLFEHVTVSNIAKTLLGGLVFDTNAIIYTNALYMLVWLLPTPLRDKPVVRRAAFVYYVVVNALAMLLNTIDICFFKFSQRRMTVEVLAFGGDLQHQTFMYMIHYWYLVVIVVSCIAALIYFHKTTTISTPAKSSPVAQWAIFIVFFAVAFVALRGWGRRPITPSDSSMYSPAGWEQATLCSPCTFIHSIQYIALKDPKFYPQDIAESISGVKDNAYLSNTEHVPAAWQHLHNPNVVVLIVESLSRDYCGYFNKGKGYTPFLDSLFGHSIVCTNGFANARHSIEGIPAVLSGLPNFMEQPFIVSMYQSDNVTSIADYLGQKGYSSAFLHGAHDNSMGFFGYAHRAGFNEAYGKSAYPNQDDYDGQWGIYDHHYLAFSCDRISELKQPFCAGIFTLSSHEPYSLPKDITVHFPTGPDPIFATLGYADWSIRQFFKKASKEPWFKNTIFVITADHCGPAFTPEARSYSGLYEVPIAFYCPSIDSSITVNYPVQQIDIMPTLLQIMHITPPQGTTLFGESIFGSKRHRIIEYADDTYQMIIDSTLLTMNKNYENTGLFNYVTDTLQHNNLLSLHPNRANALSDTLKAYIQVFDNAMIHNTLKK